MVEVLGRFQRLVQGLEHGFPAAIIRQAVTGKQYNARVNFTAKLVASIAILAPAAGPHLSYAGGPPSWTNFGPVGGMVTGVAVDPGDPRHLIVTDNTGLAHETRDRGASWTAGSVRTCEAASSGFIASGAYYVTCGYSAQVTFDSGQTWRTYYPQQPATNDPVRQLHLSPSIAGGALLEKYVAPGLTTDGGRDWSVGSYPSDGSYPAYTNQTVYDPSKPGRMVAISNGNASNYTSTWITTWESFDGTAWRKLSTLTTTAPAQLCSAAYLAIDRAGTLYMLGECGEYVSHDGGSSWSFSNVTSSPTDYDIRALGKTTGLVVDPFASGHVASASLSAILETADSGATWHVVAAPPAASATNEQLSLAFASDGAAWAGNSKGLFRRDSPGSSWTPVPVPSLRVNSGLVYPASADGLLFLTPGFRSTDGGVTWTARTDAANVPIFPVAGQPSQFYAPDGFNSRSYLLTTDGGATWKPAALNSFDAADQVWIDNIAPAGAQPGVIYGTGQVSSGPYSQRVARSTDGGQTWVSIDAGITVGSWRGLAVSPVSPAIVYAWTVAGVFRSVDSGATWTFVYRGDAIDQVVADGVDPMVFYVRSGTTVASSVDGGAGNYFPSVVDCVQQSQVMLVADPKQSRRAYVLCPDGTAFQTTDHGQSWQRVAARNWQGTYSVAAVSLDGKRLLRGVDGALESLAISDSPVVLGTATWWNPAESGWGVSISQHGDGQAVAVWYYYDASGKARWAIVPGGTWTDPHTFTGTLYTTRWPGFNAGQGNAASLSVVPAGVATFRFADGNTADVSFVLNDGTRSDKHILRQAYASVPAVNETDFSDLWWNPNESGWGIVMQQRGGTIFTTMFLYDASGDPTWLVAPNATYTQAGFYDSTGFVTNDSYSSDLDATTGPPYTAATFDPSKVTATKVGVFSLKVAPETIWLNYTAGGSARNVVIEREPF